MRWPWSKPETTLESLGAVTCATCGVLVKKTWAHSVKLYGFTSLYYCNAHTKPYTERQWDPDDQTEHYYRLMEVDAQGRPVKDKK